MDALFIRRVLLWSLLPAALILVTALLILLPLRAGVIAGSVTAGLVVLFVCARERGLAVSIGIIGSVVMLLYSLLHPLVATAAFANVLVWAGLIGYATIRQIREGEMYPMLVFTRFLHTRVNALEDLGQEHQAFARRGHFSLDLVFAVWPWRVIRWPSHLIALDIESFDVKTRVPDGTPGSQEATLIADPVMSFLWSPNLRLPLNRLRQPFSYKTAGGEERRVGRIDPANGDDSLRHYLQPFVQSAIRHCVAKTYTFGGENDVNEHIDKLREDVLAHLSKAESPFVKLGLLEAGSNGQCGESAQSFELELQELLPVRGSDLEKTIGLEAVAARRAQQKRTEGTVEAEMEGLRRQKVGEADAAVEALKTRQVGEATAGAAKALINAETEGIREQMKVLGRMQGISKSAVLDTLTTRRAAQAGGTMIMVPGLAEAAKEVAKVIAEQKEGGTGTESTTGS